MNLLKFSKGNKKLSKDTLITKLENWLKRFRAKNNDRRLVIKMHPEFVTYIKEVRKTSFAITLGN